MSHETLIQTKLLIMKLLFLSLFFLSSSGALFAQKPIEQWCGSEDSTNQSISSHINGPAFTRPIDQNEVITIPVVFHVLYNETNWPGSNISDARIFSQIARLNTDFRKLNSDINQVPSVWANLPADTKIEFKLACIDPRGNSTTGIVRKYTSVMNFLDLTYPKLSAHGGDDAWSTNTYLNIWTLNLEFYGVSTFPQDYSANPSLDGVLLQYDVVGDNNGHISFNKGRIASHEIGHWLGLYHVYEGEASCSGDLVNDTPPQSMRNQGCPTFPHTDQCSSNSPGVMFMNYMDNSDDACRYMFTLDQKTRMRSFIVIPGSIRYPFLSNYFGIKRFESTPVCAPGIITINLSNPMCLPVIYVINSGPVYEISHDDQKIVLGINSGITSGTVNITASSAGYNYTDDYAFSFELSPTITNSQNNGVALQKVLRGASYTCTVSNISGATFIWTIQNGVIASGQGTSSIIFVADNCNQETCQPVLIKVRTNYNTCQPETQIIFEYDQCSGNIPCCTYPGQICCGWGPSCGGGDRLFNIFPNPAKAQITIKVSERFQNTIRKVEVRDFSGNILKLIDYQAGIKTISLNTGDLKTGQYVIRIFDGNEWTSTKIRIL
jgi:hypothetical protein